MYPWEQAMGEAGRVLGVGIGLAGQAQQVGYQQRAYGAGMDFNTHGNYIPIGIGNITTTYGTALYLDDTEAEKVSLKIEEPPDEFTQLSNHKFHELLDRFYKLT